MAYIHLQQSVFSHRKTLIGAVRLGIPEVHLVGHLAALWAWCLDSAPDGRIPAPAAMLVSRAAMWTGDPEDFFNTLVEVGFLVAAADGSATVHDWNDHAGRLVSQRAANAERMRESRRRQREAPPPVTLAAVPPPADPNPSYALYEEMCALTGRDITKADTRFKGTQLRAAKTLLEQHSHDDVTGCIAWLLTDQWWVNKGVTLTDVVNQIGDWKTRNRPERRSLPATNGRAAGARSSIDRLKAIGGVQ